MELAPVGLGGRAGSTSMLKFADVRPADNASPFCKYLAPALLLCNTMNLLRCVSVE